MHIIPASRGSISNIRPIKVLISLRLRLVIPAKGSLCSWIQKVAKERSTSTRVFSRDQLYSISRCPLKFQEARFKTRALSWLQEKWNEKVEFSMTSIFNPTANFYTARISPIMRAFPKGLMPTSLLIMTLKEESFTEAMSRERHVGRDSQDSASVCLVIISTSSIKSM